MCRVLSYLGAPIRVDDLLYNPDNSFIKQSYNPRYMHHLLNLAGFGIFAWEERSFNPKLPFIYKTTSLPFYDANLRNLTAKITPNCLLTHIRGVSYNEKQIVSPQNLHPFMFGGTRIALAHNGLLINFDDMKYDLLKYILPRFQKDIRGTTDSEWIYAVFISQFEDLTNYTVDSVTVALIKTFKILQKVRNKHNLNINSPLNLFITNGDLVIATRFSLDFNNKVPESKEKAHEGYHSLWYTYGEDYGLNNQQYMMKDKNRKTSIIIASEPLTEDATTWTEVPESTLIAAWREKDDIMMTSQAIHI